MSQEDVKGSRIVYKKKEKKKEKKRDNDRVDENGK